MLPNKTALIFGALLHDVGKVVYRGDSTKGTHSELGATFISEEVAAQNDGFDVLDGSKIVEQIRFHHAIEMTKAIDIAPDSLAWITYFADNISAGMDRKNEGDEAQKAVFDKDTELRKIFNIINGRKDDNTISHDDYNSIRERIKSGLIGIEVSKQGVYSLLNLLEVTTDKVPASQTMTELVDVSFIRHAKPLRYCLVYISNISLNTISTTRRLFLTKRNQRVRASRCSAVLRDIAEFKISSKT